VSDLLRHELQDGTGRRLFVYGSLHGTLPPAGENGAPTGLHKRFDPFTRTWVAVSASRNARPNDARPDDPPRECPLCPGGAEVPFPYESAVFENRFPALAGEPPAVDPRPLAAPAVGRCEVVLYTDEHEGSLATLSDDAVGRVLAMWRDRSRELWGDPRHAFVMIFENRGVAAGATLSHPHGQIYAFDHVPPVQREKTAALQEHRGRTGRCLACEMRDADDGERRVAANDSFVVSVPYAARWPYEVHVRARRHGLRRLADLTAEEELDLGLALRDVVYRYDRLFENPLAYMMVAQEAPEESDDWHLHFEFSPPNRSASQLKVRASVETATGFFINDTLPEASAHALAGIHVPDLRLPRSVLRDVVEAAREPVAAAAGAVNTFETDN
jgi:UDPglucose--hexose-1-phosphate uridylyltransferase